MSSRFVVKDHPATTAEPGNTRLHRFTGLEVDGVFWLIPEWFDDTPKIGLSSPSLAIRILPQMRTGDFAGHPSLRDPIPKAVLDGQSQGLYEVVQRPHWYVETDYLKPKH